MLFNLRQLVFAILLSSAAAKPTASKGCGKKIKTSLKPGGPSKSFTFESNAGDGTLMRRRVRMYMPEAYEADKPSPLIIAFHGKYRNGTAFERITEFSNPEINKDAIVLYPDGIDVSLVVSS
jgi:polyhydroxybutyrate depolymerase